MTNQRLAHWPERVVATGEWSQFMYGTDEFKPRLVVEHWTGSRTREAAVSYWDQSAQATWVHFLIDPQGHITQLAPLDVIAKHAYGVSPWAIGIEHVGENGQEIMSNRLQRQASYQLTCWLRKRFSIPLRGVIGHGEVTSSPFFGFTSAGWEWIEESHYVFHEDFSHRAMIHYRDRLQKHCS